MQPLETDFTSPKLDFFKPTRLRNRSDFVGIQLDRSGYKWISRYSKDGKPKERHYSGLPSGVISGIYPNDFGGLSVAFSDGTTYLGNFCGGVEIKFLHEIQPWSFDYGQVARIRKPDGTTVWENADLPRKRKTLTRA